MIFLSSQIIINYFTEDRYNLFTYGLEWSENVRRHSVHNKELQSAGSVLPVNFQFLMGTLKSMQTEKYVKL